MKKPKKFNLTWLLAAIVAVAAAIAVPNIDLSGSDMLPSFQEDISDPSKEEASNQSEKAEKGDDKSNQTSYTFRSSKYLKEHYEKHGIDMGFSSAKEYEKAASSVVNNKKALHKTEKEDGDDVYYIESTNEFVIVSKDGYIRTYFSPDAGIDYYNRQ